MCKPARIFVVILLLANLPAAGETTMQSLKRQLQDAGNDSLRAELLLQMGDVHEHTELDSALFYYRKALDLAGAHPTENPGIESPWPELEVKAFRYIAYLYEAWGYCDEAIPYFLKTVDFYKKTKNHGRLVNTFLSIGNCHTHQGRLPEAASFYQMVLDQSEDDVSELNRARALQNLANVNYLRGDAVTGIEQYQQAIGLYALADNQLGMAMCYLGLGNIVSDHPPFDRAEAFYRDALEIFQQEEHSIGIYNTIMNLGTVLLNSGEFTKAIANYRESLEIAREIGHMPGMVRNLHNLGLAHSRQGMKQQALDYYGQALELSRNERYLLGLTSTLGNISSILNDTGRYGDALESAAESLEIAKQIESLEDQLVALQNMSMALEGLGDFRQAIGYFKQYKQINDSLLNIENRRHLNQLEAEFQFEKMQQQMTVQETMLENQNLELLHQRAEMDRARLQRNSLLSGFTLMAILAALIYINLRLRKRANARLTLQNQQIEAINSRLVRHNEEIRTTRDELYRQKQIIEEKNHSLLASIRYAKTIQQALLPEKAELEAVLGPHFLIFRPKDIVSGDFYWARHWNGLAFVALADSTGHGVPGALMSIMGLSFLGGFTEKHPPASPGRILSNMRDHLAGAFHQGDQESGRHHGMDLALLAVDREHASLQFAGIGCPVYVASENPITVNGVKSDPEQDGIIRKINPNLTTASGIDSSHAGFSDHEILASPGTQVYLLTDGFSDQIGGRSGKRFSSQKLIALLEEIHSLTLPEQQSRLESELSAWKGRHDQIDDISLLSFRL